MNETKESFHNVSEELALELYKSSSDIAIDYAELALDGVFSNDLVSELPVLKTIASMCKIGLAIRDRQFAKKLMTFLKEYHSGKVCEGKKQEFLTRMNETKYREKVTDTIMIYIDRYTEYNKATIFAKLLIAHINGKYDWTKLVNFANCLDLLFVDDIEVVKMLYGKKEDMLSSKTFEELQNCKSELSRLEHLGFLISETYYSPAFAKASVEKTYRLSEDGIQFFESIIT